MSRKTIILLFILFLSPVIIYFIWPSDESRIKNLFKEGFRAIEKEDLDTVMSKASFNYRDEYGFTYLTIKESMKHIFQRMSDIKIDYENLKIKVNDKTARADMEVVIIATIGSDTGYILGDISKPVHMKFTLEKERGHWLITTSEGLPFNF